VLDLAVLTAHPSQEGFVDEVKEPCGYPRMLLIDNSFHTRWIRQNQGCMAVSSESVEFYILRGF